MRADARLIARFLATPHNRYRRFSFSELTYRQRSMGIQESSIGLDWNGIEPVRGATQKNRRPRIPDA